MKILSRKAVAMLSVLMCCATYLSSIPGQAQAAGLESIVINEFYGRGGSNNQPYSHKFVELYNPSDSPVDLDGTSLQYRSATGTGNANGVAALTGTIPAKGYFLVQLNSNGSTGSALPTPDVVTTLAPSGTNGTIWLASTTTASPPDSSTVIDKLGYGTSNSPETTAVSYSGSNTMPGSLNRSGFADSDNNSLDFSFSADVTPQNSGAAAAVSAPTSPSAPPVAVSTVTIAQIQGTSDSTPYEGQVVATRGVVTAAYPTGGFDGFYLQTPGSGGTPKSPGDPSDGIFVYSPTAVATVKIGDCVDVQGTAGEFHSLTQISGNPTVTVLPAQDCAPVTVTPLATLPSTDAAKEAYEGMLVQPQGTYTITNNYALAQYGQVGLAVGDKPLYQATDVVSPGAQAADYEAANLAKYITLDDGSSWNYLTNTTAKTTPLPYLSASTPMRTASQLSFTSPVIMDYRFQWNYQPRGQVVGHDSPLIPISSTNDRPATPPQVTGDLTIGSFNVLNYFTDLGENETGCRAYTDRNGNPVGTNSCQVRGAYSESAFQDQRAKIVAAINTLDTDVLALMEVENNSAIGYVSKPRDAALADLVAALNEAAGQQRWAFVPSPVVTPGSEDVIRTAFIYQIASVEPVGTSEILLDSAFANARYPLAQTFRDKVSGTSFVAVANHFKSKGSGADDGTGQGLSNPSREAQARSLTSWVTSLFGQQPVFLLGDFNAYSKETPLSIIESAGFTNLVSKYSPTAATYQFSGRLGSLDHVFANQAALSLVTSASVWDINGDESIAFQYSRRNYNTVDFYSSDPYASSDHDPTIVGLRTRVEAPAPAPVPEPAPSSPSATAAATPVAKPVPQSTSESQPPRATFRTTVDPREPFRPGLPRTGR